MQVFKYKAYSTGRFGSRNSHKDDPNIHILDEKDGFRYVGLTHDAVIEPQELCPVRVTDINEIDFLVVVQRNREQRLLAYQQESDHLFLEWQHDQTPEKEALWRKKVAEIKQRYPCPTRHSSAA